MAQLVEVEGVDARCGGLLSGMGAAEQGSNVNLEQGQTEVVVIARVAVWEPMPDDDRQWVIDAARQYRESLTLTT